MVIYWTNEAQTAITVIKDTLLRGSSWAAESALDALFKQIEQLADSPEAGQLYRQGEGEQVRQIAVNSYCITYCVGLEQLDILAVVRQRQSWNKFNC